MKALLRSIAFAAGLFAATSALAASALVTTDLNLRTGPGTRYARITAMPAGAIVDVRGCTAGYNWCRVNWRGYDGWASARYLAHQTGGYSGRSYSNYGAAIGIPLIAGVIIGGAIYDDDHYDRRYWRYRGRDDWRDYRRYRHPRGDYNERRLDRRDARREWRREFRDRDFRRGGDSLIDQSRRIFRQRTYGE